MFQLYCDFCAEPTQYTNINIAEFNQDEDLVYHLCPRCFRTESIRYANYRLVTSEAIKNKETQNDKVEN